MNKRMLFGWQLENIFFELLKKDYGVKREHLISPSLRADFIIEKEGKRYVVEIKSAPHLPHIAIYQVIKYVLEGGFDGGYIGISSATKISPSVMKLLEQTGIGLIRLKDRNLIFEIGPRERSQTINMFLPEKAKNLIKKGNISGLEEEFAKLIVDKIIEAYKRNEVGNLPEKLLVFIVLASLISSSLWEIINYFIEKNNYSEWIFMTILTIALIIFSLYFLSKLKKIREYQD